MSVSETMTATATRQTQASDKADEATKSGKTSLRTLAGYGYVAADMFISGYGLYSYLDADKKLKNYTGAGVDYSRQDLIDQKNKSKRLIAHGFLWAIGGALLAAFGKQPIEKQVDRLERKVANFFMEKGLELPAELKVKGLEYQQRGLGTKVREFMYDYPIEIINTYYGAVASYTYIGGGLLPKEKDWEKVIAGGLVVAGGAVSFLPEASPIELAKKPEPKSFLEKVKRFFQTKPLALASMIYMGNNVSLALDVRDEYKKSKNPRHKLHGFKGYILEAGAVLSYIASNLMVGFGSKKASGSAEQLEKGQEAIVRTAAEIIAKQSPAQQKLLAIELSEYLGKQKELRFEDYKKSPELIEASLLQGGAPGKIATQATAQLTPEAKEAQSATLERKQQAAQRFTSFQNQLAQQALSPEAGFSLN